MDASASTLAPEIGGVKLGCASNPMRVLNRLLAPTEKRLIAKSHFRLATRVHVRQMPAVLCAHNVVAFQRSIFRLDGKDQARRDYHEDKAS